MPPRPGAKPRTYELVLVGLPRAEVDLASALLFERGALGLQEDWLPGEAPPPRQPWDTGPPPPEPERRVVRAWFEEPDTAAIEQALGALSVAPTWSEVADTDWEAESRATFRPIEVVPDGGPHGGLVIAPPWDAPPGAIVIEPGQGFGTGHHPSTLQALRALWATAEGHRTALDVGCGSGILAIAAARRGLTVEGVDVEPAAVVDAERNAAYNGVSGQFSTRSVGALTGPYDLVLANLHAELLEALAADLVRLTGRTLVTAGILAERAHRVRAAFDGLLVEASAEQTDDGWVSIVFVRGGG